MKQNTFYRKMDDIRKNAVGVAQIAKAKLVKPRQDSDFATLKKANQFAGAPKDPFDSNGNPTEAFMARTAAEPVKKRLMKKKR